MITSDDEDADDVRGECKLSCKIRLKGYVDYLWIKKNYFISISTHENINKILYLISSTIHQGRRIWRCWGFWRVQRNICQIKTISICSIFWETWSSWSFWASVRTTVTSEPCTSIKKLLMGLWPVHESMMCAYHWPRLTSSVLFCHHKLLIFKPPCTLNVCCLFCCRQYEITITPISQNTFCSDVL